MASGSQVGKTTCAICMAQILSNWNFKVKFIDINSQVNQKFEEMSPLDFKYLNIDLDLNTKIEANKFSQKLMSKVKNSNTEDWVFINFPCNLNFIIKDIFLKAIGINKIIIVSTACAKNIYHSDIIISDVRENNKDIECYILINRHNLSMLKCSTELSIYEVQNIVDAKIIGTVNQHDEIPNFFSKGINDVLIKYNLIDEFDIICKRITDKNTNFNISDQDISKMLDIIFEI